MTMPLIPPFAITGAYQNAQMADGNYTQDGSQVFSKLVTPPVSGLAAELASDVVAHNTGYLAGSSVNEVQTVTVGGTPAGGNFPLTFKNKTATILFNSTAAQADTALEALSTIGTGNVAVTGGPLPGTALTVTFGGTLAGRDVPLLSCASTATLTGGTPPLTVTIAATTTGVKKISGGITAATNPAIQNTYQQRDAMRDFYDTASGNHV